MKPLSFVHNAIAGFIISVLASIALFTSTFVIAPHLALTLSITGASLMYILYLLYQARTPAGHITTIITWCFITAAILVLQLTLPLVILTQGLMILIIRSLYFHSSITATLLDAALLGTGLATAVWVGYYTRSSLLAMWSFFLIQALFYRISPSTSCNENLTNSTFLNAYQNAEEALQQIGQQEKPS